MPRPPGTRSLNPLLLWRRLSPPALFLFSFVVLIGVGTLGLWQVQAFYVGEPLSLLRALFTMTSAVCVTGLILVDTATHFTFWGQLWILLFIQLGGLGFITLTTLIVGVLGRRLSLRSETLAFSHPGHHSGNSDVVEVLGALTRFILLFEAAGALILFALFWPHFPWYEALWHAVFHSVSAFCNAGFSTFTDSLVPMNDHPGVLVVVSLIIVAGSTGYLTFSELLAWWQQGRLRGARRLSSHTWAVLVTTGLLLLGPTLLFAFFEWNGVLARFDLPSKLANAWFLAVTPRTAGFNAVDYGQLRIDSASLTIMLMVVGGSPGSMAGGVKTTTLALLVAMGLSRLVGKRKVAMHARGIPDATVERAASVGLLYVAVLTAAFFALNAIQSSGLSARETHAQFLPIAFESVSALSTVGLSMGETLALRSWGLVVVILLMFIGRVGLLSFFAAMILRTRRTRAIVRLAQEDIMIG